MKMEDPDADLKLYLSAETGCDSMCKEDASELGIMSTTEPLSSKAGNSPLNIPFWVTWPSTLGEGSDVS